MGNDGVNDLRHRPVATSQNGRVNVYKKSRGVRAGNKRFPGSTIFFPEEFRPSHYLVW